MCDNDINSGLFEDWSLTRRTFVALGAAATLSGTAAFAAGDIVETDVSVKTPDGTADSEGTEGPAPQHPAVNADGTLAIAQPDVEGLHPNAVTVARARPVVART